MGKFQKKKKNLKRMSWRYICWIYFKNLPEKYNITISFKEKKGKNGIGNRTLHDHMNFLYTYFSLFLVSDLGRI